MEHSGRLASARALFPSSLVIRLDLDQQQWTACTLLCFLPQACDAVLSSNSTPLHKHITHSHYTIMLSVAIQLLLLQNLQNAWPHHAQTTEGGAALLAPRLLGRRQHALDD